MDTDETMTAGFERGMEREFPADVEALPGVMDALGSVLDGIECAPAWRMRLEVAVEEVFVNIARYAYPEGGGTAAVRVELLSAPSRVRVRFTDSGGAFNPLERDEPDTSLSAEERDVGGLGIFMVRRSVDAVEYERVDGRNVLTLIKNL